METCGVCLSRIHVTNSQGPPPQPLGMIDGDENQGKVKNFK
jgi:D-arabinose 1-dehydrogenase-like Zn-dependent alcohol dehydrogenase